MKGRDVFPLNDIAHLFSSHTWKSQSKEREFTSTNYKSDNLRAALGQTAIMEQQADDEYTD